MPFAFLISMKSLVALDLMQQLKQLVGKEQNLVQINEKRR